jgi:uncharacterized protein YjbI with pentapeptide repeats
LPKCQFTTKYYDYEIDDQIHFCCPEEPLASSFCIFHDKDYLQDKTNYEEHKRKILDRLKRKVNHAISNNETLLCIGFQLPEFSLSDLSISKEFTKPVYFNGSRFFGNADFFKTNFKGRAVFSEAHFQGGANFFGACFRQIAYFDKAHFQGRVSFSDAYFKRGVQFVRAQFQGIAYFSRPIFEGIVFFNGAKFEGEVDFSKAEFAKEVDFSNSDFYGKAYFSADFYDETKFNYVLFEGKEKITFNVENFIKVSFMNTDLTGVRFSDKARWGGKKVEYDKFWGGKKVKEDRFKIIDERLLEEKINKEKDDHTTKDFNLGSIKAVYRSLRENYEYRMRYDEAGQFFIREMELKRKYREDVSPKDDGSEIKIKQNNWFRRNLFSLTGWY